MIEVVIESVRVSLMSQDRMVVLKEVDRERYLPIWIGPFEADAITIHLQGVQVARPLTHDLLKNFIGALGAKVSHIVVNDLRNNTFFAEITVDDHGKELKIDARPSDAIALAVRVGAPIFVAEKVMEQAGITPEREIGEEEPATPSEEEEKEDLEAFRDFVESLDLDDLDE
ncbi:MAG: bifunctional nuclease family protein [Ardenticatenia bacterium]|jgi:bifunctional DNase/RNase|nr:MAG: bifunctional nuclease family protein [Ardenticatenia bacterium]